MPAIRAVAFDLYGTLIALDDPLLYRRVPRLLGVPGRRWVELVRTDLLTTPFADPGALAEFVCRELAGERWATVVAACRDAVDEELATARVLPGVVALLRFLRQRGLKLGLVSNLSSAHKTPIARFGLAEFFDAMLFSCDEGRAKPDPEIYRELCRRLGVEPPAVLMIGDSLANDVLAPIGVGMRAAQVGLGAGPGALRHISDLGWWALGGDDPERRLLAPGLEIRAAGITHRVADLAPVAHDEQGRYNLVYEVELRGEGAAGKHSRQVFAKRYLAPESAHVEELAYRVYRLAGVPSCDASVVDAAEPFLLVGRAEGEKFAGEMSPDIAYEVGRHFALGYVVSNADLRPRNAFLARDRDGRPHVTMVDLEHCFFNLAIDVAALPDASSPAAIDALGRARLEALVKRRVLTERTLPRARSEFFDARTAPGEVLTSFAAGFVAQYGELRSGIGAIESTIGERLRRRPHLVVGTRSYRRAMAEIDLADIVARAAADPAPLLDQLLAVRP